MPLSLNKWKFVDPEPEATGVLLSDRIEYYVQHYEILVDKKDFKPLNLKPASYSLTLGNEYYYDGKFYKLDQNAELRIPPNALVVTNTAERVILPHYVAGRFGLRVEYVYKGLLVGAGPQVDPGFEGFLGCPIHNLTDSEVIIRVGDPYAWIDFARTTRLGDNPEFEKEEALIKSAERALTSYAEGSKKVIAGFKGRECLLYETRRRSFKDSLPHGTKVASSVKGLEDDVKEFGQEVEKWKSVSKHIEVGAVVATLALAITVILSLALNLWFPRERTLIQLENRVATLERSLSEAKTQSEQPLTSKIPAMPKTNSSESGKIPR